EVSYPHILEHALRQGDGSGKLHRSSTHRLSADLRSTRFGIRGGSHQGRTAFQSNAYRHVNEKITQTPLVSKRSHETSVLHRLQNFRRDTATQIQPANRQYLQREIAGLSSIRGSKHVERFRAQFIRSVFTDFADHGIRIFMTDAVFQP